MVISRHLADQSPIDVGYAPQNRSQLLPVEVLDRSQLLERIAGRELKRQQRTRFHQLIVCTGGSGSHEVDYEPVQMSAGTLLRVHPGQVQQIIELPLFDALMLVWPAESHHPDPEAPAWFPGSQTPTHWQVEGVLLAQVVGWVSELRQEQQRFDESPRHIGLMQALLCALLLRLAIEIPDSLPVVNRLPQPYLEYRELIEERLYERPAVTDLARALGYSSRTVDRACVQVTGQTAKQILDERVAFEIRRMLTHTTQPVSRIAADFGFYDPSNFSKFVKRHLGRLASDVREASR